MSTLTYSHTTFGNMLRQLRRRAGLTQENFGKLVGFCPSQIARLEADQRRPNVTIVQDVFIKQLKLDTQPDLALQLLKCAQRAQSLPTASARRVRSDTETALLLTLARMLTQSHA
ncbi:MAG: helix-turn-helix domain-containing protein [Anaerolineae bacterium]|nr:helix-turn-helix domain-containing protein [Anaerolineae bacterium]